MSKILLGIDIGAQSIKAVQLARDKNSISLLAAGYLATPAKDLSNTNQNEEQVLGNSISRLVHEMKIATTDVSASLPSSQVVTRVIDVPIMSNSELSSSINWEAEQYIPWPLAKIKLDYSIIERDTSSSRMKVLLVAAPITIVEKYMRIITSAGLTPVSLETEVLASSRSIETSYPALSNVLYTTIGATSAEIALLHNHSLVYSKSVPLGSNILSRAIAEELGIEESAAEEYKNTYGLDENKLEGKIAKIISPFFNKIFEEMEKTIAYFKTQYTNEELNTLIIGGGSAKLPGLILSITKYLGLDSQIINPFINISIDPKALPVILPDAAVYATAVGLALKET